MIEGYNIIFPNYSMVWVTGKGIRKGLLAFSWVALSFTIFVTGVFYTRFAGRSLASLPERFHWKICTKARRIFTSGFLFTQVLFWP